MKLFGNRRTGGRAASRREAASHQNEKTHDTVQPDSAVDSPEQEPQGARFAALDVWNRLPGLARGLILLLAALALLVGVIAFVWKMVVKPPETTGSTRPGSDASSQDRDESEVFHLPTNVTIIKDVDPETGEEIEVEVEVPVSHKSDYYNILIAGTDDDGGRTDTIMIARLDVNAHTVALLSVPRDTLIDARYSVPKINSVYGMGGQGEKGMEALRTQLARLLGFEVDGYVLVDFEAFAKVIELVGDEENGERGIWFNVPQRMYYTDPTQDLYIDLYAGYQHLNADECEQLVRYRYGYANADIDRIGVQQDFVRALANQCLKIGNLTKIQDFAEIFVEYVTTDLTIGNIVYFGQELLRCNFDEMETFTLEGEAVDIGGLSYYRIYTNAMLTLINAYFNPYDSDITQAGIAVPTVSASPATTTPSTSTPAEPTQPDESDDPGDPDDPEQPTDGEPDASVPEEPGDDGEPATPDDPETPDEGGSEAPPEEPTGSDGGSQEPEELPPELEGWGA